MTSPFQLHERIATDSVFITDLNLCQVRLINNATYPWILLIPRQNNIKETIDLSIDDQQVLMREMAHASHAMQNLFAPDKLNIGALGNMVPQLHVHVIARFNHDPAWPNAVWGQGGKAYAEDALTATINQINEALNNV